MPARREYRFGLFSFDNAQPDSQFPGNVHFDFDHYKRHPLTNDANTHFDAVFLYFSFDLLQTTQVEQWADKAYDWYKNNKIIDAKQLNERKKNTNKMNMITTVLKHRLESEINWHIIEKFTENLKNCDNDCRNNEWKKNGKILTKHYFRNQVFEINKSATEKTVLENNEHSQNIDMKKNWLSFIISQMIDDWGYSKLCT